MPELPEVETIRLGLLPLLAGRRLQQLRLFRANLRHPFPPDLSAQVEERICRAIARRGKYLIFDFGGRGLLWHLGMSGRFQLLADDAPPRLHEHLRLCLEGGLFYAYIDPRRFGAVDGWSGDPLAHPWLAGLGVEPLSDAFDGAALQQLAAGRRSPIKSLLMDSHLLVGVGNIYAAESLHRAAIDPRRQAASLGDEECNRLAASIRTILQEALAAGGSTISDYRHPDGSSGYFAHAFAVYGRAGEACRRCGAIVAAIRQAGRSTYFCPACQH